MTITPQEVTVLVQIGETAVPLVEAAVSDVIAFAKAHGGNAAVITQLEADQATIAADKAQLEGELDPPTE